MLTGDTKLSAGPAGVRWRGLTACCVSVLSSQILIDVVPTLPDIPLPPIQANYRPLPSIESITCSQTKRKGTAGGRKTASGRAAGRGRAAAGLGSCWGPGPCLMPGAWAGAVERLRGAFRALLPPPEHLREIFADPS